MKVVNVVAAVIKHDGCVFISQRGYGEYKGFWEFPGGKIELGETNEAALIREIKEELDIDIAVGDLIDVIEYDYPDFHLSMTCYWCEIINGDIKLLEHQDAKWVDKNNIEIVNWLPADITILDKIKLGI